MNYSAGGLRELMIASDVQEEVYAMLSSNRAFAQVFSTDGGRC